MEPYSETFVGDITYKPELTPTPIGKKRVSLYQLVWGLIRPTTYGNLSLP